GPILGWARRVSNLRPLACEAIRRWRAGRLHTWKFEASGPQLPLCNRTRAGALGHVWSHEWPHGGVDSRLTRIISRTSARRRWSTALSRDDAAGAQDRTGVVGGATAA